MDIPFLIVKNTSRLGTLVHKKKCTVAALTEVKKEDIHDLDNWMRLGRSSFNEAKK